ncbi:MAG TPA: AraC family transcriptional regulator [Actinomycetota bacterium]|nr:AraC family transcriptional regulator [Actinomycetota bacterium]
MNERTDAPVEPLNEALERLRLEGAIFMRTEYTERWALGDSGGPLFAEMMHPGAERLILFHVVASGRCFVSCGDGERYWASRGEVIVLPYGDVFEMGGVEPTETVSIMSVVPPPPWTEFPVLRYGGGGSRTDIVCGCLYSEDPLFDPALKAFPPVFVVRPTSGPARTWFDASISYALDESVGQRGLPSTKLPELLLIEILRLHLANAPASERGWFAALRDPVLAPAMSAIHTAPERKWTVGDLAAEASVSRSSLDGRFRDVLGLSPMRYVNEWRMRVAQDLLATTEVTIAAIARRVGYDSEEAFSRAFKRAQGQSPSLWRAGRLNP